MTCQLARSRSAAARWTLLLAIPALSVACGGEATADDCSGAECQGSTGGCAGGACGPESAGTGGDPATGGAATGGRGASVGGGTDTGGSPDTGTDSLLPGGCPLIECGTAMDATLDLVMPFATIQALLLTVCRNDTCFEVPLAFAIDPTPSQGPVVEAPPYSERDGSSWIEATLWGTEDGTYRLEVIWYPWSTQDLADGDVYEVVLTDATGREVQATTQAVTYDGMEPSTDPCALRCPRAHLELEPVRSELWTADQPPTCPLTATPPETLCDATVDCWYASSAGESAEPQPLRVACVDGQWPIYSYPIGLDAGEVTGDCDPVGSWQLTFTDVVPPAYSCGDQWTGTRTVTVLAAPDGSLVIDRLGSAIAFDRATCTLTASWDYDWANSSEDGHFSATMTIPFAPDAEPGSYRYSNTGFCPESGLATIAVLRQ